MHYLSLCVDHSRTFINIWGINKIKLINVLVYSPKLINTQDSIWILRVHVTVQTHIYLYVSI